MGPDSIRRTRFGGLLVTAAPPSRPVRAAVRPTRPRPSRGSGTAGVRCIRAARRPRYTPAPIACAATPVTGLTNIGGKVTVIGTWTGSEQDSFMCMVKPFMDATGIQVEYTGNA